MLNNFKWTVFLIFQFLIMYNSVAGNLISLVEQDVNEYGLSTFEISVSPDITIQNYQIIFNDMDISEMIHVNQGGFDYTHNAIITPGNYHLFILATTTDGIEIKQTINVTISTQNSQQKGGFIDTGITTRGLIYDKQDSSPQSYEVEVYLNPEIYRNTDQWNNSFKGEFWYINQAQNLEPFNQDQPQVIDYLFTSKHSTDNSRFAATVGDIELSHSQNTLNHLYRRGANAHYQQNNWQLNAFSVNSSASIGFEDGTGIAGSSNDSIIGLTTRVQLSPKNSLSAVYMDGGEQQDGLGVSSDTATNQQGNVLGLLFNSELISNKLLMEIEVNHSRFDTDTNDSIDAKSDIAYGLRLNGLANWYNYHAAYEFIGSDYNVIANPFVINDKKLLSLSGNIFKDEHNIMLSLNNQKNNVDADVSRAIINNTDIIADYSFRKGRDLSLGLNLRQNQITSSKEPTLDDQVKQTTQGVNIRMNYSLQKWLFLLSLGQSELDDSLDNNNNSNIQNISLTPGWQSNNFYIYPSYNISNTEFDNNNPEINNTILSLNLRGHALQQKLTYEFSGIFNKQDTAGNITEIHSNELKIDYLLREATDNNYSMSIGLLAQHFRNPASGANTEQNDSLLWLSFSIGMPVTF